MFLPPKRLSVLISQLRSKLKKNWVGFFNHAVNIADIRPKKIHLTTRSGHTTKTL